MNNLTESNAILMDLRAAQGTQHGPLWGHESEDLNATLLAWPGGHDIEEHVNNEVDVVIVIVAGEGEIIVNDETFALQVGAALLVSKGARRSIRAISDFSYLSIHRRRRGLMPSFRG